MEYEVTTIFTQEEIDDLNAIYEESENERVKRFHNLFYLDMRHNPEKLRPYGQRLVEQFGFTNHRSYFLEYKEGSFTRVHSDAEDQSAKTIVTIIKTSDDLVGGDTIIYKPHYKRDDYDFDVNRYMVNDINSKEDHCQGSDIIPVVIRMKEGESVLYDQRLKHEVSLVEKGTRRVLITWLT